MSTAAWKLDLKLAQPAVIKRKKRKQITDENIYIGVEEPTLTSRRIKITQVKKHGGKGRGKQSANRASDWPALNEVMYFYALDTLMSLINRYQSEGNVLSRLQVL